MEIASKIQDKLITDFTALKFSDNSSLLEHVKKFYATSSMHSRDCLIIPDSTSEVVEGQSAGNTETTREYAFRAVVIEEINSTDSDAEGAIKYSRLLNIQDVILDYIEKEPSNLRSWGFDNGLSIFKNRVRQVNFDQQLGEIGYVEVMDIRFSIYLNIIPQNL